MNPIPERNTPPECGATLERIQAVLDRIHPASILAADSHPEACVACRERIAAALRMQNLFAEPAAVHVPAGFADTVLRGVQSDRRKRARTRATAIFCGFAAAAAIALAVWLNRPHQDEFARQLPPSPPPTPAPTPAPVPPLRVNEELAKAGEAIRESSRAITAPAVDAPRMVASLAGSFFKVPPAPANFELGAAGQPLSDLPDAARTGLEPVGNTAQKAFNRLLRDVSGMKPKT